MPIRKLNPLVENNENTTKVLDELLVAHLF